MLSAHFWQLSSLFILCVQWELLRSVPSVNCLLHAALLLRNIKVHPLGAAPLPYHGMLGKHVWFISIVVTHPRSRAVGFGDGSVQGVVDGSIDLAAGEVDLMTPLDHAPIIRGHGGGAVHHCIYWGGVGEVQIVFTWCVSNCNI